MMQRWQVLAEFMTVCFDNKGISTPSDKEVVALALLLGQTFGFNYDEQKAAGMSVMMASDRVKADKAGKAVPQAIQAPAQG